MVVMVMMVMMMVVMMVVMVVMVNLGSNCRLQAGVFGALLLALCCGCNQDDEDAKHDDDGQDDEVAISMIRIMVEMMKMLRSMMIIIEISDFT